MLTIASNMSHSAVYVLSTLDLTDEQMCVDPCLLFENCVLDVHTVCNKKLQYISIMMYIAYKELIEPSLTINLVAIYTCTLQDLH